MNAKSFSVYLYFHSGSDLYGASRDVLRLSSGMVAHGFPIIVVLPYEGPLVHELKKAGVEVIIEPGLATITRQHYQRSRIAWLLHFIKSFWCVFQLVRQIRPLLIHTMTAVIPGCGPVAKLLGVPHIWHVRESFQEFPVLWAIYQHYMLLFSDSIVCVSKPIADQFTHKNDKVRVVHTGIPKEEFAVVADERIDAFRDALHLMRDDILIGVIGRIKYKRKGQEYLVEAAAMLQDEFPGVRYLCIGSPYPGNEDHLNRLLALIDAKGLRDKVIYTGDVDDIKAAFAALDVLVLTSAQPEPFGGVVVEAMASAKPVVATAIGGSIEQVAEGATGYLVPPADPPALAQALRKLIQDPQTRRQMGEAGKKRFEDFFEFALFYQRITEIYSQVINRTNKQ